MTRKQQIGFSQRIRLDWLEYTANLILAGNSRDEIIVALTERLREALSVGNNPERGNRDKAITILGRVWVTVPKDVQTIRDEGLELLQHSDENDRMLVHWCMCMAAYPFFGTVAEATGRLLRLQGFVGAAQVQRRLREQFGERETVARAARRILRAFIDWGVLLEAHERGLYRGASIHSVDSGALVVWAAKAMLSSTSNHFRSPSALLLGPHLFPFEIPLPSRRELEACKGIEIVHHGPDQEILLSRAKQNRMHIRPTVSTDIDLTL